jgi:hypothetical protein
MRSDFLGPNLSLAIVPRQRSPHRGKVVEVCFLLNSRYACGTTTLHEK